MRKLLSTLSIFAIITANAQVSTTFEAKNQTIIKNKEGKVSAIKTSLLDLKTNDKTQKREAILTIQNIKERLYIREVTSNKTQSKTKITEGDLIDSDSKNLVYKEKMRVLNRIKNYVNKPFNINESDKNELKVTKMENETNVLAEFVNKIPVLNKNVALSPFLLNFSPTESLHIDTTYSEFPTGMFITKYTKSDNGYTLNGQFFQGEINFDLSKNNIMYSPFEYWTYKGNLICDNSRIKSINILNETKCNYVFGPNDKGFQNVNDYTLEITNEFK